ncbi:MAG: BMP family ABC transporter substrate-binding protein [Acholeplasmataceae bacterium]|nr:BMP family ABC transporter substrate-binding protein [Acholeplasmataceae bacterium]
MKKVLLLAVLFVGIFALASCEARTAQIAMITDSGNIDDKSFNQGTWEGIVEFAQENDMTYKYYKPEEVSFDAYVAAIDLAVEGGAEIIVTPGFLFENAVHKSQTNHPDVLFVLIDGSPHNVTDWVTFDTYDGEAADFTVEDNTLSIFFKEHESGFLAGYAAVKEGLTELGFLGGMAVPAVIRFGIGWVAGAYYAAAEEGLTEFSYNPTYYEYIGDFQPSDDVKNTAAAWFTDGVEVIHAAAGGAGNSVMAAAQETTDKFVVGVDVDQGPQSPTVITSAMKALGVVVQQALADYAAGTFEGGVSITLGASEDAVGLPLATESFRFETFTVEAYNTLFADIVSGDVVVPSALDAYDEEVLVPGLESFITDLGYTVPEGLQDAVNGVEADE